MNLDSENSKKPDQIRSEIDNTRQRMDDTIDALGNRMKKRHLVDEAIGFIRSKANDQRVEQVKERVTESASVAYRSVADSIKAHPIPLLLIGAGAAWMIYESRKASSRVGDSYASMEGEDQGGYYNYSADDFGEGEYSVDDVEAAAEAGISGAETTGSTIGEKVGQARQKLTQKAGDLSGRAKESLGAIRQRAGDVTHRVQEGSRELYQQSRQRVAQTVDQHPVEVGLGLLALGIFAGLALPTPQKVNRVLGPRVDRLRDQAVGASQDLIQRSKHVAEAAVRAARDEIKSQGLTPEALRSKATAVADHTRTAVTTSARDEGLLPKGSGGPEDATL